MKKFHISFYGRRKGEKIKLHHETVIKDSQGKAIESLGIVYSDILTKSIASFELNLVTYGVLYQLTPHTLENAKKNLQLADGSRFNSKFVNAADECILFEKTILEDKTEYYSNAWSGDYESLVIRLKKFGTWVDRIKNESSYGA